MRAPGNELGVGIVGLGMIGALHARAVHENRRLRVAAVADADASVAARAGEAFGCAVAASAEALAERSDVDAVLVCTPEDCHLAPALAALERGKPTLVEKPLATTIEDAETLVAAARRSGALLLPGHVLRFDARYDGARRAAGEGSLGRLVHLFARRSNPRAAARRVRGRVSLIHYLGIHDIDLALSLLPGPVERVYAQRTSAVNAAFGVEDSIFTLLSFAGGEVASLECSWSLPDGLPGRVYGGLDLVGTEAAVRIDLLAPVLHHVGAERTSGVDLMGWPEVRGRIRGALADEIDHFAACILDAAPPAIAPEEALRAVRVADAVLHSIERNEMLSVSL